MLICSFGILAQSWTKDLEKNAKAGDVAAQLATGNAYLNGDGVKANPKKAAQWLNLAATAGNVEAKKSLCTFYSKELEKLAIAGDADAQYAIGCFYVDGNGVKADVKKAGDWLYKSFKQGNTEAKAKLLTFFSESLVQLARDKDADAQYALACLYLECKADETNEYSSKSMGDMWLGDAAANGHAEAKAKVLASETKSGSLITLAKSGDPEAAWKLAMLWLADGDRPSMFRAADNLMIAAKGGNTKAADKLMATAKAYLNGRGVEKNEDMGYYWLSKAAASGNKEAQEQFYSNDSRQLRNAANDGDVDAMMALGALKSLSEDERFEFYYMAIKAGHEEAMDEINKLNFDVYRYALFNKAFYETTPSNYDNILIKDKDAAYIVAMHYGQNKYSQESQERGLKIIKRLKASGHKLSIKAYDEYFFTLEYETYDILKAPHIVGFKGHDVVMCNGQRLNASPISSEEFTALSEAIPDFGISASKVRSIKGLEFNYKDDKNDYEVKGKIDIFFLPGLVAIGPKSTYEISCNIPHLKFEDKIILDKYTATDSDDKISRTVRKHNIRLVDYSTGLSMWENGALCAIQSDTVPNMHFCPEYTFTGIPTLNFEELMTAYIFHSNGNTTWIQFTNQDFYKGYIVEYMITSTDNTSCRYLDPGKCKAEGQEHHFEFSNPNTRTTVYTDIPDYNIAQNGQFKLNMLDIHNNLNAAYIDNLQKTLYHSWTFNGNNTVELWYGMDAIAYKEYQEKQAKLEKAELIKKYNKAVADLYAQYRKDGFSAADITLLKNNAKSILDNGPFVKGLNIKLAARYRGDIHELRRDLMRHADGYPPVWGNIKLDVEWDDSSARYYFTGAFDIPSGFIYTSNGRVTHWAKVN